MHAQKYTHTHAHICKYRKHNHMPIALNIHSFILFSFLSTQNIWLFYSLFYVVIICRQFKFRSGSRNTRRFKSIRFVSLVFASFSQSIFTFSEASKNTLIRARRSVPTKIFTCVHDKRTCFVANTHQYRRRSNQLRRENAFSSHKIIEATYHCTHLDSNFLISIWKLYFIASITQ